MNRPILWKMAKGRQDPRISNRHGWTGVFVDEEQCSERCSVRNDRNDRFWDGDGKMNKDERKTHSFIPFSWSFTPPTRGFLPLAAFCFRTEPRMFAFESLVRACTLWHAPQTLTRWRPLPRTLKYCTHWLCSFGHQIARLFKRPYRKTTSIPIWSCLVNVFCKMMS